MLATPIRPAAIASFQIGESRPWGDPTSSQMGFGTTTTHSPGLKGNPQQGVLSDNVVRADRTGLYHFADISAYHRTNLVSI